MTTEQQHVDLPEEAVEAFMDFKWTPGRVWRFATNEERERARYQLEALLLKLTDADHADQEKHYTLAEVRERLEEPIHALASTIGRARVHVQEPAYPERAAGELRDAAEAMGRLRAAFNTAMTENGEDHA